MSERAAVLGQARHAPKRAGLSLDFRIADWMAFAPGMNTKSEWRVWSGGAVTPDDEIAEIPPALPSLLRRRVSPIGQLAFRATQGMAEDGETRFVFCSRHGEFARTHSLLQSLAADEPVSPADFSLSVHHALAGLLSMARKNHAGHTAIAAGRDSFAFGLLEAATCLAAGTDEAILLVYFDEPLPEEYGRFNDADETSLALALLMRPAQNDDQDIRISGMPRTAAQAGPATGQALDFLRFLTSGAYETTSPGERMEWRWSRVAA